MPRPSLTCFTAMSFLTLFLWVGGLVSPGGSGEERKIRSISSTSIASIRPLGISGGLLSVPNSSGSTRLSRVITLSWRRRRASAWAFSGFGPASAVISFSGLFWKNVLIFVSSGV